MKIIHQIKIIPVTFSDYTFGGIVCGPTKAAIMLRQLLLNVSHLLLTQNHQNDVNVITNGKLRNTYQRRSPEKYIFSIYESIMNDGIFLPFVDR